MPSFASPDDLAALLKKPFTAQEREQALRLLAGATARIRAVTDQWISEVEGDVWVTDAPADRVLWLPQRPVSTVTQVLVDGVAVTDWRLRGSRLVRSCAWWDGCGPVPELQVTYTHGYKDGDERLDLAVDACMAFAAAARSNPDGLKSESIDDYTRAFSVGSGGSDSQWAGTEKALRAAYGRRPKTGSINTAA